MAYYYVRSPFSGIQQGQECYCGQCANNNNCNNGGRCTDCGSIECRHNTGITGLCCPVDILGSASTGVRLYVSSNIRSIRTIRTGPNDDGDGLCRTAPPAGFEWVNEGVKVRLYCGYNAGGILIGTVFFGHLMNRIADGIYNSPSGRMMGYLGDNDCDCPCYDGIHAHMERSSANGYTYYRNCGTQVYTSTSIYRWTGPDVCPV